MPEDLSTPSINKWGKLIAGILLVVATSFAITTLFAYWPDKMPALGKGDDAWYTATHYQITLLDNGSKDSASDTETANATTASLKTQKDSLEKKIKAALEKKDTTDLVNDSVALKKVNDLLPKPAAPYKPCCDTPGIKNGKKIHLNTILLILVATMGFLGNMIHIAASFTSFVGNESFKKSWILWYFVKPFTAAGLAIIVYFIIRAGFLGYGSDASSISLYGVMSLSALAGLFTDNATLKLKEIFDVVFKPKDERKDKLHDAKITVTGHTPEKIDVEQANQIEVKGQNFKDKKLSIKMNDQAITDAIITATTITFNYTVGEADKSKTSFKLLITDEAGQEVYKNEFAV